MRERLLELKLTKFWMTVDFLSEVKFDCWRSIKLKTLCIYSLLDLFSFKNLDHEVIFDHAGDLPMFQAF